MTHKTFNKIHIVLLLLCFTLLCMQLSSVAITCAEAPDEIEREQSEPDLPSVIDPSDDLPNPNDDSTPDVITVDDDEELVITEESGKSGDVSAVAEKSVNVGLIVGVSVGAAAAVIAIVVIVLVVRSKNKVKPKKRKRRR